MTLVYIGGPITGHADLNKPAFDAAERQLQKEGYITFNPHTVPAPAFDIDKNPTATWRYYMRYCIRELTKCDAIYMLANWQNSIGAVWEHRIAEMIGLEILYQPVLDHE